MNTDETARQEPTMPDADPLAPIEALVARYEADELAEGYGGELWGTTAAALRAAIAEARALLGEVSVRERIAQAIEAEYEAWASLGNQTLATPTHSIGWFVERAYINAAHIARDWQPVEPSAEEGSA